MSRQLTPDLCVIGAGSGDSRSPPAPRSWALRLC